VAFAIFSNVSLTNVSTRSPSGSSPVLEGQREDRLDADEQRRSSRWCGRRDRRHRGVPHGPDLA